MARVFENPTNGYREEVGFTQSLLTFLFCLPYLAIKGLWPHFVVVLLFIAIPIAAGGAPVAFFLGLIVSIIYSAMIQSLLAGKYLRAGWKEVIPQPASNAWTSKPITPTLRKCPMCAEDIKFEAIKCKHCGADIDPIAPPTPESAEEAADRLGIKRAGSLYLFLDRQFTRIEDAISFAEEASALNRR